MLPPLNVIDALYNDIDQEYNYIQLFRPSLFVLELLE